MITRSTVASARWVTATEDASSIRASLASAAGDIGLTLVSSDDFRHKLHELAAPGKSIFFSAPPMIEPNGMRRSASAKSITGVFQAQCQFLELSPSEFPGPITFRWNKVVAQTTVDLQTQRIIGELQTADVFESIAARGSTCRSFRCRTSRKIT